MADDIKALLKAAANLGVKVTGLPTPRKTLPKTKLGGMVDELHDLRDVRLAVGKIADALEKEEKRLGAHIIDNVEVNSVGIFGSKFKAVVYKDDVPLVEDWNKFYEHIRKTKGFDLLNKAVNRAAVKERKEAGKAVPGLGNMQVKKLSITKVK